MHHLANHPMLPEHALRAIEAITEKYRAAVVTIVLRAFENGGEVDGNLDLPVLDPQSDTGGAFNAAQSLGWITPQLIRRGEEWVKVRIDATGPLAHKRGGGVGVYDLTVRGNSVARAYREKEPEGYPTIERPPSFDLQPSLFG